MSHDATFVPVVRAGFALVVLIAMYHRLRAATREPLDRRQEGVVMMVALRLAGAVLWVSVILFMIDPAWMAWSSVRLSEAIRWSGVPVFAGALALLTWTLQNLGPNLTDTVVTRREHTLVTRGPYRWVRHPFYDTMALFVLANVLLAANWFMLAAGAVVFALLAIRSQTEEEKLLARFGEPYRAYRARTGRFVPRLPRRGPRDG